MICAIVLAAGESRRMGAQKLLLPFGSTTVIAHVVDQLLRSVVDKVLVVVGHDSNKVAEALCGRPVTIVANPDYQSGMLSSARCGLRALPPQCQAVLVALGDQPAITTKLVDDLVHTFTGNDKGIVVPVFRNKRGHPIVFSARYRDEILTHYDDTGLRGLLHAHPDDLLELPASTPAVLSDLDYPEDYRRELTSQQEEGAVQDT
jgi:molybdenum cofactor cytidylyltransferase